MSEQNKLNQFCFLSFIGIMGDEPSFLECRGRLQVELCAFPPEDGPQLGRPQLSRDASRMQGTEAELQPRHDDCAGQMNHRSAPVPEQQLHHLVHHKTT